MRIVIDTDRLSEEITKQIFTLIGKNFELSLSGKEKSELLEDRLRKTINEKRPKTTDYDFETGQDYFFTDDKVELKQFNALGSSPKLQQVKPHLYDKILVAAEFENKTEWWLLLTKNISSNAGKENKENGKLVLQRQHKGNLLEGQITFTKEFKKQSTLLTTTGPINYKETDLGLNDYELKNILILTKNH